MFSEESLELARWMQDKYYTSLSDCLKCVMPAGIQVKTDEIVELISSDWSNLSDKLKQICVYIQQEGNDNAALKSELIHNFGSGVSSSIKALQKKRILAVKQFSRSRDYTKKVRYAALTSNNPQPSTDSFNNTPRGKVLKILSESESGMPIAELLKAAQVSVSPIKTLEAAKLIKLFDVEVRRSVTHNPGTGAVKPKLTSEQQSALNYILAKLKERDTRPILLHGVTGSGKTEVYLRIIEHIISIGKQAIVLVPEISLTPQTLSVFINRFGDLVTVTHSRLSPGERLDQWKKAHDGSASVMIGPRSAIFAPFLKLGVIIIDEEHEHTYKSEVTPKYSAKEVAIKRAAITGASVILGSATPSLDSYFSALKGDMGLTVIKERVNRMLPVVNIVDMRLELADGNRSIFSEKLKLALAQNIRLGKQSILFLNRRGHSTFVSCRRCGYVCKCDHCSVNYTYHIAEDTLVCHYCGKSSSPPKLCPACGSRFIKFFGLGTQKVEEETKKLFPGQTVLRMDFDTTRGKHGHEELLRTFRSGDASILIGTQMIAKGLDFPNVTVVGIISADVSLNNGDFRAGEVTYQLLTQVSGRAGRADSAGHVYIQTYNPEHYSIDFASKQDYESFYKHEIVLRRQMNYPPFSHIFSIMFTGPEEKSIITALNKLLEIMKQNADGRKIETLGPAPAQISKINNNYRWKLLIKAIDEETLKEFVLTCMSQLEKTRNLSGITPHLTMDPMVIE
jgi:primosomal protein N' (replication factor Y)